MTEKRTVPIAGMMCAACSARVERKLQSIEGIQSAAVSLPGRSALIEFDDSIVTLQDIKKQVDSIGYEMIVDEDKRLEVLEQTEWKRLKRRTLLAWALALLCMSISMGWLNVGNRDAANQIQLILALASIAYCGRSFYITALKQLRHGSASMDTLIALSTFISFIFSAFNTFWGDKFWAAHGVESHTYFDASVMIIAFVLTGRLLEGRARNSTASAIRGLMQLAPKTARIVQGEETQEVPISTLIQGDTLDIRTGEKVPVDGVLKSGEARIDESAMTGEAALVEKKIGDKVLAGTLVREGQFQMTARQVGEKTVLARMIRMVEEAQGTKPPVQRIADRAALVFVPTVIAIALLTFFLWLLIGGTTQLPQAILSAVSVLVIACPCAMGLATPTAIMVGVGKAAQKGILVKDATALEKMRKVDALVIDKTGTLTYVQNNVEMLKPHTREAVAKMQEKDLSLFIMSGDKREHVEHWAKEAGITNFRSEVMPQDKENLVRQLQQEGHCVAMAGDGINDSQALAAADVSFAMGKGTDVAIDVAQVTLMHDDLRLIPTALRLSQKTVRAIRENLFWAFIYNIICIPLAAGLPRLFGSNLQITPIWASALMAFSSLSVVLNSLRLKFSRD